MVVVVYDTAAVDDASGDTASGSGCDSEALKTPQSCHFYALMVGGVQW